MVIVSILTQGTALNVMKRIIIEASSKEVCIRCYNTGEIISPKELAISRSLLKSLRTWFKQHAEINHRDSIHYRDLDRFEKSGIDIAVSMKQEIPQLDVHYQSDLLMIDIGSTLEKCCSLNESPKNKSTIR